MASDGWGIRRLGALRAAPGPRPTLIRRDDGQALLYAGSVHALTGDPGVGKNWLAAWGAAQVLADGGHVVWLDGERNGEQAVESRLVRLGASNRGRVLLIPSVDPEGDLGKAVVAELQRTSAANDSRSLAVVDGVFTICNRLGLDPNEASAVDRFHERITDPLVDLGFTVLLLLPRGKSRSDRTRKGPSGSVEWTHRSDAVLRLSATNDEGLRPGYRAGTVSLHVEKDRHGGLLRLCDESSGRLGTFSMIDTDPMDADCRVSIAVAGTGSLGEAETPASRAPRADRDAQIANGFRAALADGLRLSWTALRGTTPGNLTTKARIRDEMLAAGLLLEEPIGRGSLYWLATAVPGSGTVRTSDGTGNDAPTATRSVLRPPQDRGTGTVAQGPEGEDKKKTPATICNPGTENDEPPKATRRPLPRLVGDEPLVDLSARVENSLPTWPLGPLNGRDVR